MSLPPGFKLDTPAGPAKGGLPPGFRLDPPKPKGEFSAFADTPGLMEEMRAGRVNPDQVSPFALATDPIVRGFNNFVKLATTSDPKAQADILNNSIHGSTIEDSEQGPIITLPNGERRYVNESGFSGRDIIDFGANVAKYAPASGLAAGGASLVGRLGMGLVSSAATSVAEDKFAERAGSEQGVDASKAAVAGVGGMVAEGIMPAFRALAKTKSVSAVSQWASQHLKPLQDAGYVIQGKLTATGIEFAKKLGLDVKAISARLATAIQESVDDAVDEKAIPIDAASRAFNVRVSRGQALQDAQQQALERNIAATDVTTPAGPQMSKFFDDQQAALIGESGDSGAGLVQSRLSNGNPQLTASSGLNARGTVNERISQAGDTLVKNLPGKAAAAKAASRAKYKEAESAGVLFEPESVRGGIISTRAAMREAGLDRAADGSLTPAAAKIDARLGRLNRWLRPREGKRLKPIDMRMIERERQRINTALRSNGVRGTADERILLTAKNSLDDWFAEASENAIFSRDPGAIDVLMEARTLYAQYKKLYSGKDGVGTLLKTMANREVSASEAIDGVLGAGQIGGNKVSIETLGKLKDIFGENSAEWAMMREAAWLKVLQKSIGRSGGKDRFQIGTFLSSYTEAFTGKGRDVMKALYSPEEIKQMDEFYRFASSLQVPENVGNPSKSGYALMQMFQQVAPKMGLSLDLAGLNGMGAVVNMIAQRTGGKMDWKAAIQGAPRVTVNPALPRAVTVAGALASPGAMARDQEGQ